MNRRKKFAGFTLIELLTVIAIIGILVALLFPAIKKALQKAEISQAQNDIKNIEGALKSYFTEYGKWPNGNGHVPPVDYSYGKFGAIYTGYCENFWLIDALRAVPDSEGNMVDGCGNGNNLANPRKIQFLEVPAKSLVMDPSGLGQNFVDPWGHPYQITVDTDYNNICTGLAGGHPSPINPAGSNTDGVTNRTSIVWSLGPDGIGGTKDDITSW